MAMVQFFNAWGGARQEKTTYILKLNLHSVLFRSILRTTLAHEELIPVHICVPPLPPLPPQASKWSILWNGTISERRHFELSSSTLEP